MTINEYLTKMKTMSDEDFKENLLKLMTMLTPVSRDVLSDASKIFLVYTGGNYTAYKIMLTSSIEHIIGIEILSPLRKIHGLSPIDYDTEIYEKRHYSPEPSLN